MELFQNGIAVAIFALAVVSLIAAIGRLLLRWKSVRGTTLVSAWWWALAALGCWLTACVLTPIETVDPNTRTALWYFAAVLTVCPGIAVLGARRPVSSVWSVFVVAPLILVLSMPVISSWNANTGRFGWILIETPMLLGFCLVILMGCGNYVGTRFTGQAILVAIATFIVVRSFRIDSGRVRPVLEWLLAANLLSAAVIFAGRRKRAPSGDPASTTETRALELVWARFVNAFGVVWAKRVGERVNRAAEEERLPVRLDFSGTDWAQQSITAEQRADATGRLDFTLNRLLKRFVSPEWFRADPAEATPSSSPSDD